MCRLLPSAQMYLHWGSRTAAYQLPALSLNVCFKYWSATLMGTVESLGLKRRKYAISLEKTPDSLPVAVENLRATTAGSAFIYTVFSLLIARKT